MDVCFNTSDVMPTVLLVFISISIYNYSTIPFLYSILFNILYINMNKLMMNTVKE